MSSRRGCGQSAGFHLPGCPTLLVLSTVALATFGCESTQHRARQESLERWNQVRAQVKVKLASDQLSAGHVEDAANELAQAARLDPDHPELLTLQARVCLARGDQHDAQRLLERAAAQGAQRAEIDYLLGTIQQQRLQWDQAFNHFVRAANEDPQEVAYVVAVARNMLQLGEAREALSLLRSHQNEFGWTAAYNAAVGECHEQLGDWRAAVAAWEKVVADRDAPALRERLALALQGAERRPEAILHLRRLLEEAGLHSATHLRLALAQCLLETGQPLEAQEQLSRVLREQPQNAPALQLLARAFARQGHYERARRTAERVLLLEPDSLHALELVAALAYRTGDTARALVIARQIMATDPGSGSPVAEQIIARLTAGQAAPE